MKNLDIKKENIFLDSNKYFNRPDKFEGMDEYSHVIPVDMNGAAVPRNKDDRNNIADAQASIRKRFDLGR